MVMGILSFSRNGMPRIALLLVLTLFLTYHTLYFLRDIWRFNGPPFSSQAYFSETLGVTLDQKVFMKMITARFRLTTKQLKILLNSTIALNLEEAQNAREVLLELCPLPKYEDESCEILPPFATMPSQFKLAKRYSLAACTIFKNMSTLLASIMCYLHNPREMVNRTSFYEGWDAKRPCLGENMAGSMLDILWRFGLFRSQVHKFALVREPMEKFLSGFINQCKTLNHCDECRNLKCTLDKVRNYGRGFTLNGTYNGSESYRKHVNAHFFPQNWRCEFSSDFEGYDIIRYNSQNIEDLKNGLKGVFRKVNVPEGEIDYIMEKLDGGRGMHSTVGNLETMRAREELERNSHLLRRFTALFYFDYLLLGYKLPPLDRLLNSGDPSPTGNKV